MCTFKKLENFTALFSAKLILQSELEENTNAFFQLQQECDHVLIASWLMHQKVMPWDYNEPVPHCTCLLCGKTIFDIPSKSYVIDATRFVTYNVQLGIYDLVSALGKVYNENRNRDLQTVLNKLVKKYDVSYAKGKIPKAIK